MARELVKRRWLITLLGWIHHYTHRHCGYLLTAAHAIRSMSLKYLRVINLLSVFIIITLLAAGAEGACPPEYVEYKYNIIEFTQVSWADGLQFLPNSAIRSAKIGGDNDYAEIATVDLNGDRYNDKIIRFVSPSECGTHGCSTHFLIFDVSGNSAWRDLATNTITPTTGSIHLLFNKITRVPAGLLLSRGPGIPEKEFYWSFHWRLSELGIEYECTKIGFLSQ